MHSVNLYETASPWREGRSGLFYGHRAIFLCILYFLKHTDCLGIVMELLGPSTAWSQNFRIVPEPLQKQLKFNVFNEAIREALCILEQSLDSLNIVVE